MGNEKSRPRSPGVCAVTALAAQDSQVVAVDDREGQAELRFELVLPLADQASPSGCGHAARRRPWPDRRGRRGCRGGRAAPAAWPRRRGARGPTPRRQPTRARQCAHFASSRRRAGSASGWLEGVCLAAGSARTLYWHSGSLFAQSRKIVPLQNCSRDEGWGYRCRRWIIGRRRAVTRRSQQGCARFGYIPTPCCREQRPLSRPCSRTPSPHLA